VIWVGVTFLTMRLHGTQGDPFVVTARYPAHYLNHTTHELIDDVVRHYESII